MVGGLVTPVGVPTVEVAGVHGRDWGASGSELVPVYSVVACRHSLRRFPALWWRSTLLRRRLSDQLVSRARRAVLYESCQAVVFALGVAGERETWEL